MHVDDFIMYAGEVGTTEENMLQNSYFQNDIKKMKELNNGIWRLYPVDKKAIKKFNSKYRK